MFAETDNVRRETERERERERDSLLSALSCIIKHILCTYLYVYVCPTQYFVHIIWRTTTKLWRL